MCICTWCYSTHEDTLLYLIAHFVIRKKIVTSNVLHLVRKVFQQGHVRALVVPRAGFRVPGKFVNQ